MQNIILMIIEKFGYIGVLLLVALENVFPPMPSEVILLFSGFATNKTNLNFYLMIIFSTFGSLIGAMILYFIGTILNKERIKDLLNTKWGGILKLKETDIDKAESWFNKQGTKAVFVCRFIPLIRSLISIPAGINKMNKLKFLISTLIGSLIWNSGLILIGNRVGDNWAKIAIIFERYSFLVIVFMMIFILIIVMFYYYKRFKKKN